MSIPSGGNGQTASLNYAIDLSTAVDAQNLVQCMAKTPQNVNTMNSQPFMIASPPMTLSSQPFSMNRQTYSLGNQPFSMNTIPLPTNNQPFSINTQSFTISNPVNNGRTQFPMAGQSAFLSNLSTQNIMSICSQPSFMNSIPAHNFMGQAAMLGGQNLMSLGGQSQIMNGQSNVLGSLPLSHLSNATIMSPNLTAVNADFLSNLTAQQPFTGVNGGLVGLPNQPLLLNQSAYPGSNSSLGGVASQSVSNTYQLSNSLFLNPNINFPLTTPMVPPNPAIQPDVRKILTNPVDASVMTNNYILLDDDEPPTLIQSQRASHHILGGNNPAVGDNTTTDSDQLTVSVKPGYSQSNDVTLELDDVGATLDWDVESKMVDDTDDVKSIEEGDDGVIMASGEEGDGNKHEDKIGDAASEMDELEFNWEEYLEMVGASAVPPTAFKHVECSLQSGFVKGMKLEVPNKTCPDKYWVASVVMTCGPLLRLRYEGYEEDSSADFWCDLSTAEIHHVGWCAQNGQTLKPPQGIQTKYNDWGEFLVTVLTGARTAPEYLLKKGTGTTPIDQLKLGMYLEVQHRDWPNKLWVARLLENVGGRLYLRYEGAHDPCHDFWLFYLDPRVHPVGWGRERGYRYVAPSEILYEKGEGDLKQENLLQKAFQEAKDVAFPVDILKDQPAIVNHSFEVGWKLEMINPITRNNLCPGTVVAVINNQYFIVDHDNLMEGEKQMRVCCHARSANIFPAGWGLGNGLKLVSPKGWSKPDFNWAEYLTHTNSQAAPKNAFILEPAEHEFGCGMKLEAANVLQPDQICVATIVKVVGSLLWIHVDSGGAGAASSHIEDVESMDLFPVGWCESNGYQLKPPRMLAGHPGKRVAVVQPELSTSNLLLSSQLDGAGKSWCPKIYFNHRCFTGRHLNKGQIAKLPKSVGPGPMQLVMKEVLSMLISVAYKSCRVLREIQLTSRPNVNMQQEVLKAKYKSKSYCAVVEICKNCDQLEEFLRSVCIKLECCPNLISPHVMKFPCPENCFQLTKTKYNYYYGKIVRKIGRPPGAHTNIVDAQKKRGRRRHRKKIHFVHRKTRLVSAQASTSDANKPEPTPAEETVKPVVVRRVVGFDKDSQYVCKRQRKLPPPPSDIQTRGAKKPKFSFERKTHKKIMVTLSPTSPKKIPETATVASSSQDTSGFKLDSNPLGWSVTQLVDFIQTTDCAYLAKHLREQEIDGQAFLLLTLPTVQEHLHLKLGPAVKLCHLVEKVKVVFYDKFAA